MSHANVHVHVHVESFVQIRWILRHAFEAVVAVEAAAAVAAAAVAATAFEAVERAKPEGETVNCAIWASLASASPSTEASLSTEALLLASVSTEMSLSVETSASYQHRATLHCHHGLVQLRCWHCSFLRAQLCRLPLREQPLSICEGQKTCCHPQAWCRNYRPMVAQPLPPPFSSSLNAF